jgi:hypothetical protein
VFKEMESETFGIVSFNELCGCTTVYQGISRLDFSSICISSSTFSLRELVFYSVAAMMNLDGSRLSHFGQDLGWNREVRVGGKEGSGSCMTLSIVSIVLSDLIDKTLK